MKLLVRSEFATETDDSSEEYLEVSSSRIVTVRYRYELPLTRRALVSVLAMARADIASIEELVKLPLARIVVNDDNCVVAVEAQVNGWVMGVNLRDKRIRIAPPLLSKAELELLMELGGTVLDSTGHLR